MPNHPIKLSTKPGKRSHINKRDARKIHYAAPQRTHVIKSSSMTSQPFSTEEINYRGNFIK